ncbi:MAG: type II secretion system secretin GspD [Nitrospiraceae bacterium]|nr:type II secretion system secretin GspD [Nitrospiraceae bacterium]
MKITRSIALSNRTFSVLALFFILVFLCGSLPAFAASDTEPHADVKKPVAKSGKVTFNFVDVELSAVAKFISEITGKNFIFDDRVKGKITIIAPSKLSSDDAYNLFTSVLELKGFTVVPSGVDAYKIIPSVEAKQRGLKISTEGPLPNEEYIARLISLKYVSADDALKFFQPLISKDGHISIFGPGNLLLVIDSGLNIDKVLSLVDLVDKPSVTDMPDVIPLKYANADSVMKILNDGFGRARARIAPGQMSIDSALAMSDQRLNAVILTGDRSGREAMKVLIGMIDKPSPEAQGRINVYFLENADATELAKVLEGMIRGLQNARPAAPGAPAAQASPFESAGGITITPDKATNAIVVMASPADYQNIAAMLKQLDRRRKQVYVEAMIVEASISKLLDAGTKWRATATQGGNPVVIGGVGQIDSSALSSILSGLAGFTMGGMGNFLNIPVTSTVNGATQTTNLSVPGFAALFSLSEFRDSINVLSTPQLLTSDNKEAEIVVGENVPFIGKRERDLTTTGTVMDSIERKDVGITLRLTPQITEGDYVKLDIYQEISALQQGSETILTTIGPTTTKRSTKTSVVVKDNSTVVIGGLMQEKDEVNVTKIPFLGDIPVLGYIFKQKSVNKEKTNLLIFLTPHIVKEAASLSAITSGKKREFAVKQNRYVEGELFVTFRQDTGNEKAAAVIASKGASVIASAHHGFTYRITLRAKQSVEEGLAEFRALPEIETAEPVYDTDFK